MSKEQLEITKQDILDQVTKMGREITINVEALADSVAGNLSKIGIKRNTDGSKINALILQVADTAIGILDRLQANMPTLEMGPDDLQVQSAMPQAEEVSQAVISVKAAIYTLLGDTDNQAIRTIEEAK